MLKKLLIGAVLAVAFACSAGTGTAVAQQTNCQRCVSNFSGCVQRCSHLSGDAKDDCIATCDRTKSDCLDQFHCKGDGNRTPTRPIKQSRKCDKCEKTAHKCNARCAHAKTDKLRELCERRCSTAENICLHNNNCEGNR